jgi:hypothetical protein
MIIDAVIGELSSGSEFKFENPELVCGDLHMSWLALISRANFAFKFSRQENSKS